jgi:hypothetical protein
VILPLVLAVAPAVLPATAQDPRVAATLAALPAELAGLPRDAGLKSDERVVYRTDASGPSIIVGAIVPGGEVENILRDKARRDEGLLALGIMFAGNGRSQLKREAYFFVGDVSSGARGLYREYATDQGLRLVWATFNDGVITAVIAVIPRPDDQQRIFDPVMRELFSGATLITANK